MNYLDLQRRRKFGNRFARADLMDGRRKFGNGFCNGLNGCRKEVRQRIL
ncbi:hypothetical protein [Microcoleus vaginatus]